MLTGVYLQYPHSIQWAKNFCSLLSSFYEIIIDPQKFLSKKKKLTNCNFYYFKIKKKLFNFLRMTKIFSLKKKVLCQYGLWEKEKIWFFKTVESKGDHRVSKSHW